LFNSKLNDRKLEYNTPLRQVTRRSRSQYDRSVPCWMVQKYRKLNKTVQYRSPRHLRSRRCYSSSKLLFHGAMTY